VSSRRSSIERDIKDCRFRVELSERGRPSLVLCRDDYESAIRQATRELLGSGGDRAEIYVGRDLVAVGGLQYRDVRGGGKFSVRFSGEKPRKR
jgi:hypothetical protein